MGTGALWEDGRADDALRSHAQIPQQLFFTSTGHVKRQIE